MHLLLVKTLNFKPSQDSFCETYRFEIPRQRITFFSLKKGKMKKRMTLKLVSTIFHCFWKNNVLFGYFEQNTLKRNLTYSCFIFPLFHKHLFSPGPTMHYPPPWNFLFRKNNCMCNRDNARDVAACPEE